MPGPGRFPARPPGNDRERCGQPLQNAPVLAADPVVLRAAGWIGHVISEGGAVVFNSRPLPAARVLEGARSLASQVLAAPAVLPRLGVPPHLRRACASITGVLGQTVARPAFMAPRTAEVTAAALTASVAVLAADTGEAIPRLRIVHDALRETGAPLTPTTLTRDSGQLSEPLRDAHLRALAGVLRPSNRLRYRTTSNDGQAAATGNHSLRTTAGGVARAAHVPQQAWDSWARRLDPTSGRSPELTALNLAPLLLLPGNNLTLPAALHLLGQPGGRKQSVSGFLQHLDAHPHGKAALACIAALAERLDQEGSPIDYSRRRRLFSDGPPLSPAHWRTLCRRADVPAGSEHRLRLARGLLHETLTGSSLRLGPPGLNHRSGAYATRYRDFITLAHQALRHELHSYAEELLSDAGITSEPLTWEPPLTWVSGPPPSWPGEDPDRVDIDLVHKLLLDQPAMPLTELASAAGCRLNTLRTALGHKPLPHPRPDSRGAGPAATRTLPALPVHEVRRLYEDDKRSLREVAEILGVSRQTVQRTFSGAGVTLRTTTPRVTGKLNEQWVRTEYLQRHRPIRDIAAELGTPTATLNRYMKTVGIPLRPRGGPNRRATRTPDRAA